MFLLHIFATLFLAVIAVGIGNPPSVVFRYFRNSGSELYGSIGAAVIPSLFGHTIVNFLTARIPAFEVSLFLMMQPVFGNLIAWLIGLQGAPGLLALLSIPLVIYGGFLATVGSSSPRSNSLSTVLCGLPHLCARLAAPSASHRDQST